MENEDRSKVIEDVLGELKEEALPTSPLTSEQIVDMRKIEGMMAYDVRSMSKRPNSALLERYIAYKVIEERLLENDIFENLPYFRVNVEKGVGCNHYVSLAICIELYTDKKSWENRYSEDCIALTIDELFYNCSSVVLHNFECYRVARRCTRDISKAEAVKKIFGIFEEICKHAGYSVILYTVSEQETVQAVADYVKGNYELIKKFPNKRNGHDIMYYTKDIVDGSK
jgi:hypothetical protein